MTWDESKHPRHPSGSPQGGEFAPGAGDEIRTASGLRGTLLSVDGKNGVLKSKYTGNTLPVELEGAKIIESVMQRSERVRAGNTKSPLLSKQQPILAAHNRISNIERELKAKVDSGQDLTSMDRSKLLQSKSKLRGLQEARSNGVYYGNPGAAPGPTTRTEVPGAAAFNKRAAQIGTSAARRERAEGSALQGLDSTAPRTSARSDALYRQEAALAKKLQAKQRSGK